jgi:hypothetical protein
VGGDARKLIDDARSPALSPDGSQILVVRGPVQRGNLGYAGRWREAETARRSRSLHVHHAGLVARREENRLCDWHLGAETLAERPRDGGL